LIDISKKYNVESYDVLTGFKWIADIIKKNEGKKTFIGGGEESYGFMIGDFIRDKDAVSACALIAETAVWAADKGLSLYDMLLEIYLEFGLYKESLISLVRKGKAGAEEIEKIMSDFRSNPPVELGNSKIVMVKDYQKSMETNLLTGKTTEIKLPKSNVLQFFTADGSKVSVRPSGTEPKIKFYFGVKAPLHSKAEFEKVNQFLDEKIKRIIQDLRI
jgi:phosphoglucomutase